MIKTIGPKVMSLIRVKFEEIIDCPDKSYKDKLEIIRNKIIALDDSCNGRTEK